MVGLNIYSAVLAYITYSKQVVSSVILRHTEKHILGSRAKGKVASFLDNVNSSSNY